MADSPIVLSIQIPGMEPLRVALSRFADNISDFTRFWEDYFLPSWYDSITTHYVTQGRSTGDQWASLSAAYAAWKQKHWPGLPTGVLSGALRESLTYRSDPNAVVQVDATQLTVGTRVPYAMYLQKGTRRMPARPPMRVGREFMLRTVKLLQEYGVKTARGSGLS